MTGPGAFALRLGLGPVPADLDDLIGEIGDRLGAYDPLLSRGPAGLELSLTVVASDLWVAVLLGMAAVTNTGYGVVELEARPVERNPTYGSDQDQSETAGWQVDATPLRFPVALPAQPGAERSHRPDQRQDGKRCPLSVLMSGL